MINKKTTEFILNQLVKHKRFNFFGLGTFFVKPARKGEHNTKYGKGKTKYKWRVSFKSSIVFKEKLNKALEEINN